MQIIPGTPGASGTFIVPNGGSSLNTGYQAYQPDGVTPQMLLCNKDGNTDVILDPQGAGGFAVQVCKGAVSGGTGLFMRNQVFFWAESADHAQDLPIATVDGGNNLLLGNASAAGASLMNDTTVQLQAGKQLHVKFNATDRLTLDESNFNVYGGNAGNGITVQYATGGLTSQGDITAGGRLTMGAGEAAGFYQIASGVVGMQTGGSNGSGWLQNTSGEATLAGNFTKANATFGNTNLSRTLVAGRTYRLDGYLVISNSTAGEGGKIDFNGGGATATAFRADVVGTQGTNTPGTLASTSLAGVINWTSITGTNAVRITGFITVNQAGTLVLRAAENSTATGTFTLGAGSWLALSDTLAL